MKKYLTKIVENLESLTNKEQEELVIKIFNSYLIFKELGFEDKEAVIKSINTPTNFLNKKYRKVKDETYINIKRKNTKVFRSLYRYKDEILDLHRSNVSCQRIIDYLYLKHRIKKCSRQSMFNFIREDQYKNNLK